MGKESIQRTGEVIFALIDARFGSDAAFERAANLPPKTVSNWRRGRSSSYMKLLPELAALFEISVRELLCDESLPHGQPLTQDEKELLMLYRAADALTEGERMALNETLRSTIDLYLSARRSRTASGEKRR